MQQEITIPTQDGHVIYGTLDALPHNKKLLIFVHGLTGSQNQHNYFNAVPYFLPKGFNTFRFDLYSKKTKGRQLSECFIATHVDDLALVMEHFRGKDIILIGHSLGATVILESDLSNVEEIILWDPTNGFPDIKEKKAFYCEEIGKYILKWGKEILLSPQMMDDWKSIDPAKLIRKITVPCKIIFAGKYNKHIIWMPYLKDAAIQTAIVEGAMHNFHEEGTEAELFRRTLEFLM